MAAPHCMGFLRYCIYDKVQIPLLFQLLLRQVQFKNGITLSRAITQDIENVEPNFQVVKCSIMGVKMTKQKFSKNI